MQHGFYKGALGVATLVALFLLLGFYRENIIPAHANHEQQRWLLTGDEPGYLLAGAAFAAGDGLDLWPTQRRGEHLRFFDRDILEPGQFSWAWHFGSQATTFTSSNWWGQQQIKRQMPGLPVLIAPFAHHAQYRWSVAYAEAWSVVLLAALVLWFARRLPLLGFAGVACANLCFLASAPVAFYATQVFPETFTALFLVSGVLLFDRPRAWQRWLGCLLLVVTLWLTPRVMAGMGLVAVVLAWRALRRREWGEALIGAIGLALFFAYNLLLWDMLLPTPLEAGSMGTALLACVGLLLGIGALLWWRPRARTVVGVLAGVGLLLLAHSLCTPGPLSQDARGLAKLEWFSHNLFVVFFGNDVGLFFLNPALWLGLVAALWLGCFQRDDFFWLWLALFVGVLMSVAITPEWRAGTCPAGRYGVIPAYLLLLPLARCFALASSAWQQRLLAALVMLGLIGLTTGWFMAHAPNFWYRAYHPLFGYAAWQPYYDLLPPSDPASHGFKLRVFLWTLVFCASLGTLDAARGLKNFWLRATRDPLF